jgi:iron complex transport system ATP-binding protein
MPDHIRADSISVSLGGARILDRVDLAVRGGEFIGIIGPNGAGKSTLLRALVGMVGLSSGSVTLLGRDLAAFPARERARAVSYLGQDPPDAFPFTVIDVVLMGRYPFLARFARESADDMEKARRAIEYVGLSGFEERLFTELSGGERQLVLFARVLAQETDILLLDEPTANLDIRHQDQFFSMAWELAGEGKVVVASLHNLNVASQYCSRLVLLDRGVVVADGKPQEVLRPDVLDAVYGTRTVVSASAATGSLTVSVVPRGRSRGADGHRVHLIGGAGSAVNVTRELARRGCRLSGGIAHENDADETLWKSLGIPHRTVGAFSRIQPSDVDAASAMITEAEAVILTSFPIGVGNMENLALAARARRLVVVESGPEDMKRIFFSPEAERLFTALLPRAERFSYPDLVASLETREFWQTPLTDMSPTQEDPS